MASPSRPQNLSQFLAAKKASKTSAIGGTWRAGRGEAREARTALAPAGWRSLQLRNQACQQLGPQRLFRYRTYVGFLHRLVPASHGRRADKFWSRTKVL